MSIIIESSRGRYAIPLYEKKIVACHDIHDVRTDKGVEYVNNEYCGPKGSCEW